MSEQSIALVKRATGMIERGTPEWLAVEDQARRLYAPKLTDTEWELFKMEASEIDLSPVRGEFIALSIGREKRKDAQGREFWADTYKGYVTIAGVRALAARTGMLIGTDGPYWCGQDGRWQEVWLSEDPPAAAKFSVYIRGGDGRGFTGVCTMKRARKYKDRNDNGIEKLVPIWANQPEMMLAVRAEVDAYKRAGLLQDPRHFERGIIGATDQGVALFSDEDESARRLSGKRVHAIASGRGVGHDGVRSAVRKIDPDTESLSQADPYAMAAAADEFEIFDAEGVALISDTEAEDVKGEPANLVPPEPDEQSEWMTEAQAAWLLEHGFKAPSSAFNAKQQEIVADPVSGARGAVKYSEAEKIIRKVATFMVEPAEQAGAEMAQDEATVGQGAVQTPQTIDEPTNGASLLKADDDAFWDDFWKRCSVAGIKGPTGLKKAAGLTHVPETPDAAEQALTRAMANRRTQ